MKFNIILHEGENVNFAQLKKMLETQIMLKGKKAAGMYVYAKGHDYPESNYLSCTHVWARADKTIDYINKYMEQGRKNGKVCFSSPRCSYWFE